MFTWRIRICIVYLSQSITNKGRLICTGPPSQCGFHALAVCLTACLCNRSATVLYTRYILLGCNSTQSPTFPLVCNDCQCQKPISVNLVMRSVLQTHTQPTQQHCCPLYGLELNYTFLMHQLCGPSCPVYFLVSCDQ